MKNKHYRWKDLGLAGVWKKSLMLTMLNIMRLFDQKKNSKHCEILLQFKITFFYCNIF